ncbi:MAG: thioredoxin-like domain-containing protein [Acidobacteriota bacterium]|nr:thioredoxin-like domain-containing protein [Acidobacteriota bacterium]
MSGPEHTASEAPQGPIAAPSLDGAVGWLNVAAPISIEQLRGKVVILDFWTYGCINCVHILRDLKTLQTRFPEELVVIGVHSPKFTNEKANDNLKRILVRYEIEHPVANDADHHIWRRYGVQAWPTRVIVDPAGNIVGTAMGEGNLEGFISAVRTVVRVFDEHPSTPVPADSPAHSLRAGGINRAPLPLDLERRRHADRPLLYPGKVLADEASGRLLIADSNHNRIVVASLDGHVIETIGSGFQGDNDGIFSQARFYRPQGLALDDDNLYVADTENHQIRVVDFQARAVHTVAGTGKQGAWSGDGGDALRIDLNSPWDLALKPGILIVAMAGPHQIWVVDLLHGQAYPYAGTGQEAKTDGPVNTATFAQPSGLAIDPSTPLGAGGNTLFVADAEANVIRAVVLPPGNSVSTIAGGDLFKFGDADGSGDAARLQHPLGVAVYGGRVFIADTYNHKIKLLDPVSRTVTTFAGTGKPGHADGPGGRAQFFEPGGLSVAGNTLYVADTNNHAVRTIDIATREVGTLVLDGLTPPAAWSYLR